MPSGDHPASINIAFIKKASQIRGCRPSFTSTLLPLPRAPEASSGPDHLYKNNTFSSIYQGGMDTPPVGCLLDSHHALAKHGRTPPTFMSSFLKINCLFVDNVYPFIHGNDKISTSQIRGCRPSFTSTLLPLPRAPETSSDPDHLYDNNTDMQYIKEAWTHSQCATYSAATMPSPDIVIPLPHPCLPVSK